jgi:penicillin-insensitive murein endopeptidase
VPPAAASPAGPAAAGAAADEAAGGASDEEIAALDDDVDEDESPAPRAARPTPRSPLLALGDAELEARYKQDPTSVGPISAGRAGAGVLLNGVQMPRSDRYLLLDPGRAYGTRETVDALARIIDRVNERYPDSAPLPIGHLSAQRGGHLSPHVSHQSGRDADVGYYYRTPVRAFVTATADNLDMPRTWALVKAAIRETDVEMILMDRTIQRLLADYAAQNGEDPAFIDESFQIRGRNARAPIRHIKGHHNHLHFRFNNPVAEELGRRLARFIVVPKHQPVTAANHTEVAGVTFAQHRARSGDTLVVLAKRYGTTVEEIQRANGLKGIALKIGQVYRIPQKASPRPPPGKPAPPARKPAPARR